MAEPAVRELLVDSGVAGTPTFFVNDRRHHGAYDVAALLAAVQDARTRQTAAVA